MRHFFIFFLSIYLIFSSCSFAFAGAAALRMSTGVISNISSSGATYGGASGSRIVATTARSWASGYAASAMGLTPAGAAGGYEAVQTVALSRGATAGLLRLGVQAARCASAIGLIITAAQVAGMVWEWYTDANGDSYFRQSSSNGWRPAPNGGSFQTATIDLPGLWNYDGAVKFQGKTAYVYDSFASFNANKPTSTNGGGQYLHYTGHCSDPAVGSTCTIDDYYFYTLFSGVEVNHNFNYGSDYNVYSYSVSPVDPSQQNNYIPVPWDDVQEAIEDDLSSHPDQWAQPWNDAMNVVPATVNPWNEQAAEESAAQPAPSPTPDPPMPYPVPNATPSPAEFPNSDPLPNQLTKEDISKVMADVLSSLTPSQQTDVSTGDVTQPSTNQDLANQIEQIITNNNYNVTVQGSPNVNVVNQPTVHVAGLAEQLSAIQANQHSQIARVAEIKPALDLQIQAINDVATATNAETAKIAEIKADTALSVEHLANINTNLSSLKDTLSQPSSTPEIPQPPYDVNVLNEPTVKIKTEEAWRADAQSELSPDNKPEENEDLDIDYPDEDEYEDDKRDMSFLDDIYSDIQELPLFELFEKRPISVSSGSSQLCLDIPDFGMKCIDLNDYSSVFETLGQVSVALCFFACLAIIFL